MIKFDLTSTVESPWNRIEKRYGETKELRYSSDEARARSVRTYVRPDVSLVELRARAVTHSHWVEVALASSFITHLQQCMQAKSSYFSLKSTTFTLNISSLLSLVTTMNATTADKMPYNEDPTAWITANPVADFLLMYSSELKYLCMFAYTFLHGKVYV